MPASFRLIVLLAFLAAIGACLTNSFPAPLPATADRPFGLIGDPRFAAATPVRNVAFSPDGLWLAGTGRGEVRLWNAVTGQAVRRIAFGDSAIGTHVAFTPDGQTILVLAFEDKPYIPAPPYHGHDWPVTVRRFNATTGTEESRVRLNKVNARDQYGRPVAAFTPDGLGVVLGGCCFSPTRFSTVTGQKMWVAELPMIDSGHAQWLTGIAVSPDGAVVAAAQSNSGDPFHLLDAATGAVLGRLAEPAADYGTVAFSADGKSLATTTRGTSVVVWDVATRTPRARLTTANLVNTPLALSPAGDRVAIAEYDQGIRVYDVATGRETARSDGRMHWPTVAFSPDGSAVAATAGRVIVLDAATGNRRGASGWSPGAPPQFVFSADGARVHVRTGVRDELITYQLPSGREVARVANDPAVAAALGFRDAARVVSADGRLAATEVTVGGDERAIEVTEAATGRERCRVPFNRQKGYLSAAGFSADGGLLYTVGAYEVGVWDSATGRHVRALAQPAKVEKKLHPFLSLSTSPRGQYVAVFADTEPREASTCGTCNIMASDYLEKTVTIWDASTWKVVRTVKVPAGCWLLWQTDDRFTVETVARRPVNPRWRWVGSSEDSVEERLRFDPLPGLGTHEVEEWTIAGGQISVWRFDPPPRERLVSSPDGRVLAGFDPEDPSRPGVRLYEAVTGRELHRLTVDEPCRSVSFSPDGRYLLTDHPAAGVRVWEIAR